MRNSSSRGSTGSSSSIPKLPSLSGSSNGTKKSSLILKKKKSRSSSSQGSSGHIQLASQAGPSRRPRVGGPLSKSGSSSSLDSSSRRRRKRSSSSSSSTSTTEQHLAFPPSSQSPHSSTDQNQSQVPSQSHPSKHQTSERTTGVSPSPTHSPTSPQHCTEPDDDELDLMAPYSAFTHNESPQQSTTDAAMPSSTFITATNVTSDLIPQNATLQAHDGDAYENSKERQEIQKALEEHRKQQDEIRNSLHEFLSSVKGRKDDEGNPLVEFPEAYDSIVDYLKQQKNFGDLPNHLIKQFIDASSVSEQEAMDDIKENEDIAVGMNRIRKLDLLLHQNEEKHKDLSKRVKQIISTDKKNAMDQKKQKMSLRKFILAKERAAAREAGLASPSAEHSDDDQSPSTTHHHTESNDDLPYPEDDIFLTKAQQDRISQLLEDHNIDMGVVPPGEGFEPTLDEKERIHTIDAKLREIAPSLFSEESSNANEQEQNNNDNTTTTTTAWAEDKSEQSPTSETKQTEDQVGEYSTEHRQQIQDIDAKIARLYENNDATAPKLTEAQLEELMKGIQMDQDAEKTQSKDEVK